MRKERMEGIESKSRNRSAEDNVRIFNEMKNYTEEVSSALIVVYTRAVNSASAQKSR